MSLVDIPASLLWRLRDHGLGRVGTPNGTDLTGVIDTLLNRAKQRNRAATRLVQLHETGRFGTEDSRTLLVWAGECLAERRGVMHAAWLLHTAWRRAYARDADLRAAVDAWVASEQFQRAVSDDLFDKTFGGHE